MIYQILITELWRGSFIVLIHGNDKGEAFWILTTLPSCFFYPVLKRIKGERGGGGRGDHSQARLKQFRMWIQRVKGKGEGKKTPIHIHAQTCTMRTHAHMHTDMHIHAHTRTHAHMRIDAHMHTHMHRHATCTHTHSIFSIWIWTTSGKLISRRLLNIYCPVIIPKCLLAFHSNRT